MDETEEVASMPTHELMAWLSEGERDRFVKFQETFESPGWKLVEEYAQGLITYHIMQGANAKTWEKVNQHRGARQALELVANMREAFMASFEQQARANQISASEEAADAT